MDDGRKKLMSHILMVVAPFLMLLSITVAWFISSNTAGMSAMTFASQSTGPGAVIYKAAKQENRTPGTGTLTYDLTWGPQETVEHSNITVENMVPGQCSYYLLVAGGPFTVKLGNPTLTDKDGKPVTTPQGAAALPMAQCTGFYLIPTKINLNNPIAGQKDLAATISLTRDGAGQLTAAAFKSGPAGASFVTPTPHASAYILAVYCDPIYGQGTKAAPKQMATLEGNISFSMSFELDRS